MNSSREKIVLLIIFIIEGFSYIYQLIPEQAPDMSYEEMREKLHLVAPFLLSDQLISPSSYVWLLFLRISIAGYFLCQYLLSRNRPEFFVLLIIKSLIVIEYLVNYNGYWFYIINTGSFKISFSLSFVFMVWIFIFNLSNFIDYLKLRR